MTTTEYYGKFAREFSLLFAPIKKAFKQEGI
jgi:hypothetical protein